jgi:hypothetical protein
LEAIGIPPGDRFQVITQHPSGDLIYSPDYLGVSRSDRVVFVQISMSTGRKTSTKARTLQAHGRDLGGVARPSSQGPAHQSRRSFVGKLVLGNGEAQYMDS